MIAASLAGVEPSSVLRLMRGRVAIAHHQVAGAPQHVLEEHAGGDRGMPRVVARSYRAGVPGVLAGRGGLRTGQHVKLQ